MHQDVVRENISRTSGWSQESASDSTTKWSAPVIDEGLRALPTPSQSHLLNFIQGLLRNAWASVWRTRFGAHVWAHKKILYSFLYKLRDRAESRQATIVQKSEVTQGSMDVKVEDDADDVNDADEQYEGVSWASIPSKLC